MKIERFGALITYDKALPDQQILHAAGIGVIVIDIHSKSYRWLLPLVSQIQRALEFLQPGQVVHISNVPG
jgi:hypothetical protein